MSVSLKGVAVITGASAGIGAVYADRLARRGYDLVLVARNEARLDQLATRLADATGRAVKTVVADLRNKADLKRIETIIATDPDITMLVNNAGVGGLEPLLQSDVDAIAPEVLNGVYGGTKAFVLALGQSLQKELADKNVRIQTVLPGATATNFWDAAGGAVDNLPSNTVMRSDDLVDAALAGFDQGEVVTIPSLPDAADWANYEAARQKLMPNLSLSSAPARYRAVAAA
jgi:short-subunit dehydrogenase